MFFCYLAQNQSRTGGSKNVQPAAGTAKELLLDRVEYALEKTEIM
jgi:hypothetical protein